MNGWIGLLNSSVGKKFVLGLTGLLLCVFLVFHLAGNLLLFVGPEAYNNYARALHEQEFLVKLAEAGLVVLFALHILFAITTTRMNRAARKRKFEMRESKREDRIIAAEAAPDTWMFTTGAIVLFFLIWHLADFTWGLRLHEATEGQSPFERAVTVLQNTGSFYVYIVGSLVLGFHLGHGFASAFQSLGVNHARYNVVIRWVGILFSIVMAVGFASFPFWASTQ